MHTLLLLLLLATVADARADAKAGEKKAQLCLLCHKAARASVPLLEAQPAGYLVAATHAYKSGKRVDPAMQMQPNVRNLAERDLRAIAAYFASQPAPAGAFPADAEKAAAGERLVRELNCAQCHGGAFAGGDLVPRLAGQSPGYLVDQLEGFAAGRRAHPAARMPSGNRGDLEAIAQHLTSLRGT